MARKIEVIIAGDSKGLKTAFGQAQTAAGRFGSALGTVAKGAALALGGIAVGVGAGLASAFGEARDAEKIGKITESVIRSTGGAANLTAQQVADLSAAISNKTGIDDEAIQSNNNLLLTFTKVRNEVGQGNDVFNRAAGLVQDMATVMGTDAQSSALQLGKALNDPIAGITALGRAGVQFTKEQKEQIKTLVESGDILAAQKVILDEVGKQFGGAAEAAATPTDKLKVTIGNLQEQIGTALIPVVDKAATFLGDVLPKAAEKLSPIISEIAGGFTAFTAAFSAADGDVTSSGFPGFMERLANVARRVVDAVVAHWPQIRAVALDVLGKVSQFVTGTVLPALEDIGKAVLDVAPKVLELAREAFGTLMKVLPKVVTIGGKLVAFLVKALGFLIDHRKIVIALAAPILALAAAYKTILIVKNVMAALQAFRATMLGVNAVLLANPAVAIAAAIVGLAAAAVYAYQNFEPFRNVVDTVGRALKTAFDFVMRNWQTIGAVLVAPFAPFIALAVTIVTHFEEIVTFFKELPGKIVSALANIGQKIWDGTKAAWDVFKTAISTAVTAYVQFYLELPGRIIGALANIGQTIWSAVAGSFGFFKTQVSNLVNDVVGFFVGLPFRLISLATNIFNAGKGLGEQLIEGLKSAVSGVTGVAGDVANALVNAMKGIWNEFANRVNDIIPNSIGWGPASINLPNNPIPRFHGGGVVDFGPDGEGLAQLRNDEVVFTPEQMDALGRAGVGNSVNVVVHVGGSVVAERDLVKTVKNALIEARQRGYAT